MHWCIHNICVFDPLTCMPISEAISFILVNSRSDLIALISKLRLCVVIWDMAFFRFKVSIELKSVSYTHLTLPTILLV